LNRLFEIHGIYIHTLMLMFVLEVMKIDIYSHILINKMQ